MPRDDAAYRQLQAETTDPWTRAYWDLSVRARGRELMDEADVPPAALAGALRGLRAVNRLLSGPGPLLRLLERGRPSWPADRPVWLLDVGTGSADIPQAALAWARRRGVDLRVIAVDLHPATLSFAADWTRADRAALALLRADAFALPVADRAADYVHCSLFLHHFDDAQVLALLREFARVAARGVVVNDLLRNRRALAWFTALSTFGPPVFRHDGRLSVRRGFTRAEVERLAGEAGLGWCRFQRLFGHRFALAGERPAG